MLPTLASSPSSILESAAVAPPGGGLLGGPGGVMDGFDLLMSTQSRKRMSATKSESGGSVASSMLERALPRPPPPPVSAVMDDSRSGSRKGVGIETTSDDDDDDDDLDSLSSLSTVPGRGRGGGGAEYASAAAPSRAFMTPEQIAAEKREILYQLGRLESKGVVVSRRFTMSDPIEDMRAELDRLKLDREVDLSVRFQKRILMTCVNGIELLNKTFDPFGIQLEGWSDNVHDSICDYDEVLEDLHMKYRTRGSAMAPELKLLMMLGGSGVMFHMTASMFRKTNIPGLQDVLRQNPALMTQIQNATMSTMMNDGSRGAPQPAAAPPPPQAPSSPPGMLGSLFGNLFGGGGGGGGPMPPPPSFPQPSNGGGGGNVMRGPKPVQEMLRDMHKGAFDKSASSRVDILNDESDEETFLMDDDAVTSAPAVAAAAPARKSAAAAPRGRKPKSAAGGGSARNTVTVGF